jgi:hypothetical protein
MFPGYFDRSTFFAQRNSACCQLAQHFYADFLIHPLHSPTLHSEEIAELLQQTHEEVLNLIQHLKRGLPPDFFQRHFLLSINYMQHPMTQSYHLTLIGTLHVGAWVIDPAKRPKNLLTHSPYTLLNTMIQIYVETTHTLHNQFESLKIALTPSV